MRILFFEKCVPIIRVFYLAYAYMFSCCYVCRLFVWQNKISSSFSYGSNYAKHYTRKRVNFSSECSKLQKGRKKEKREEIREEKGKQRERERERERGRKDMERLKRSDTGTETPG